MSTNTATLIGTIPDSEIIDLCLKGRLISSNFQQANVKQACYELRSSNIYYDLSDGNKKYQLNQSEFILIKPKQLLVVITMEFLDLGADMLGRVLTKGKLFSLGLLPVNTYADPGFQGQLGIVLYNLSNNYLKIPIGTGIAKIEFSRLEKAVASPYRGQHGYQTGIWPIPDDMIVQPADLKSDKRIKDPSDEITTAYGEDIGRVIKRVFKFERYLILAILVYLLLTSVLLYSITSTDIITPLISIAIGVVSNVVTSLLIFFATNIRK